MSARTIATLHLPLPMGAVGRILRVIAQQFPDAVVGEPTSSGVMDILADPDLTTTEARRVARERRVAVRP